MGIIPNNTGGRDVEKVAQVFVRNGLMPLQEKIREVNTWMKKEVVILVYYNF